MVGFRFHGEDRTTFTGEFWEFGRQSSAALNLGPHCRAIPLIFLSFSVALHYERSGNVTSIDLVFLDICKSGEMQFNAEKRESKKNMQGVWHLPVSSCVRLYVHDTGLCLWRQRVNRLASFCHMLRLVCAFTEMAFQVWIQCIPVLIVRNKQLCEIAIWCRCWSTRTI